MRNRDAYQVPVLLRVHRDYVGGELVRVTLEPIAPEDVVELHPGAEFVTVLSLRPLDVGSWTE